MRVPVFPPSFIAVGFTSEAPIQTGYVEVSPGTCFECVGVSEETAGLCSGELILMGTLHDLEGLKVGDTYYQTPENKIEVTGLRWISGVQPQNWNEELPMPYRYETPWISPPKAGTGAPLE